MAGAPRTVNFTDVSQSLLEIDGVKEVHDLRMWSLSMNKVAIAVHLAVGLYIVLDLFNFSLPSTHVLLHDQFCKHWTLFIFCPHENVELLTFMCHIIMYISSWNSASNVSFFLYIYREGQRSNGCAEDKYPHSPKEVRYIGERDSDWGVSSYYVWMQWMPGSARLMTLHQYGLKKVVCLG